MRHFSRREDITFLLTVLTLLGVIWTAFAKPERWDQAVTDMSEIKPRVYEDEKQIAVIISRLDSINEHLASIDQHTKF